MINHNGHHAKRFPKLTTGNHRLTTTEAADRSSRVASDDDDGELSLTSLLRRHLFEVETDGKTWAQHLVEAWIKEAVEGNFRALQEILIRIDGEAKSHEEAAVEMAATPAFPQVDEVRARKILEAFHDDRDALPGD